MEDDTPPATPLQPARRSWLAKIGSALSTVAFVAFVCWLVNGTAHGGRFLWVVVALFVTPIVLYLLFLLAVGTSFVRQARRNVREAQRNRRGH